MKLNAAESFLYCLTAHHGLHNIRLHNNLVPTNSRLNQINSEINNLISLKRLSSSMEKRYYQKKNNKKMIYLAKESRLRDCRQFVDFPQMEGYQFYKTLSSGKCACRRVAYSLFAMWTSLCGTVLQAICF